VVPFSPPKQTAGQPGGSLLLDQILILLGNTFRSLAASVTNSNLVPVTFNTAAFPDGQRVFHGLGQVPSTFEAVNMQAPGGIVSESSAVNPNRDKYLVLQCTTDIACAIRFV